MTIEELTEIATNFLRKNYGMGLGIPIVRNNRLRRVLGSYFETRGRGPLRIEVAGFLITHGAPSVIVDTLKHELIHYALNVKGEPNDDGHPHFEAELSKHGVPSTRTNIVGLYYVSKCQGCGGNTYSRNKRVAEPNLRFLSGCCKTDIDYVGERIYNGTEAV